MSITAGDALSGLGCDPADAITDAGTALQEALRASGAKGKNLSVLLKSACKIGLLDPSDHKLQEAIHKVFHWASATRSQKGDSHVVSTADEADAWLMVHVVAALIVWLADKPR